MRVAVALADLDQNVLVIDRWVDLQLKHFTRMREQQLHRQGQWMGACLLAGVGE